MLVIQKLYDRTNFMICDSTQELSHDSMQYSVSELTSSTTSRTDSSSVCSSPMGKVGSISHWTAEEDERLDQGIDKHGFSWTVISKIYFSSETTQHVRTPSMVRNRYLRRYKPKQAMSPVERDGINKRSQYLCSRCGELRRGHTCKLRN